MGHSTLNQSGAAQAVPVSNVVPFPKAVMRGRKRLAGSINGGAGEISLNRSGPFLPANVVSLIDFKADACDPSINVMQGVLIGAILQHLDFGILRGVHQQVRDIATYTNDPERRALGNALSRLTGAIVAEKVFKETGDATVFVRESDGKRFDIKGELV